MALPHQHAQRASRELFAVIRGDTSTHEHLRNRLLSIIWITIGIDIIATALVFAFERHAVGTQISTIPDAFLYATGQLLTASSVDAPTSGIGKVLQLLFDIYALTVVAALAGSFGSFFHGRTQEHEKKLAAEKAAAEK